MLFRSLAAGGHRRPQVRAHSGAGRARGDAVAGYAELQDRFFDQQAFELELEGKTLQADRLAGVSKLSSIATYLVTIVLGLKALGVNVGALVTFGGISGLAIGLAGRQILENAFMGLMLYATAPFMPGDEIVFSTREEKNIQGHVIDIGLFRTSIRRSSASCTTSRTRSSHPWWCST